MIRKAIQIFMSALLFTVAASAGALAQEQKTNLKDETFFVEHNGEKFLIQSKIEAPVDNPAIERLLCERLFGNTDGNLKTALKKYLDRFDKVRVFRSKSNHAKYVYGMIGIGVYHSDFFSKANFISDEYKEMSRRYAPFYYYIQKSKGQKMANIGVKEVKGWFTYDMETGRLLDITDVFTKEAIEKLNIADVANSDEVLFSPYDRTVSYFVTENGTKTAKAYSIWRDEELFADWMKPFSAIAGEKQKEIDVAAVEQKAMKAREAAEAKRLFEERLCQARHQREERNNATLKNIKPYYQSQTTKMKNLYLYVWGDTCYVSGINKDIMTLTDDEIDRLARHSGCGYIAGDIREAREFVKNGGSTNDIFSGDEEAYKKNGNAYPVSMCDYAPMPLKSISFEDRGKIWGLKSGDKSFIRYVIDSEGNLRMPIVFISPANDFIQKSADLDKYHISQIRKVGKWQPATKNGKNVNAVCISEI